MTKVMAALAILVGGIAVIFNVLAAFGVDLTDDQQGALSGAAALVLLVLGVWFHPDIPIGHTGPKPPQP